MFRTIRRWFAAKSAPAATNRLRTRLAAEPLEAREVPTVAQVVHLSTWFDFNGNRVKDWNEQFTGTGTMIGRDSVLTCAHNLYNNDPSKGPLMHASEVIVAPGRSNSYMPYGQTYAYTWHVPTSWTWGHNNSDIAVLRTAHAIGDYTGWFGYAAASDASLRGVGNGYRIIGYPGNPLGNGFTQATVGGQVHFIRPETIGYNQRLNDPWTLRTAPGNSGSALLATRISLNGRVYSNMIVGVHVRGAVGSYGESVRITNNWFNFIQNAQRTMPLSGLYQSAPQARQAAALAPQSTPIPQSLPVGSLRVAMTNLWKPVTTQAAAATPHREEVSRTDGGVYLVKYLPANAARPNVKQAATYADDDFAGLYVG
jgi:V8-like Glu-specific endopeptidase